MSEQLDDFKTALTKNQTIIDTLKRERDQLRTVVNQIHVSVGEDPASDDETLPGVVTAIKSTVDYQRDFREEINRLRELLRECAERGVPAAGVGTAHQHFGTDCILCRITAALGDEK